MSTLQGYRSELHRKLLQAKENEEREDPKIFSDDDDDVEEEEYEYEEDDEEEKDNNKEKIINAVHEEYPIDESELFKKQRSNVGTKNGGDVDRLRNVTEKEDDLKNRKTPASATTATATAPSLFLAKNPNGFVCKERETVLSLIKEVLIPHLLEPFDTNMIIFKGKPRSQGCNRFWKGISDYLKKVPLIMPEDERSLNHFPLVRLENHFYHDKERSVPIFKLSQRSIFDIWEGLEWHVLSNPFFKARTKQWLKQVLMLIELLLYRTIEIGSTDDQDTFVLNHEQYSEIIEAREPNEDEDEPLQTFEVDENGEEVVQKPTVFESAKVNYAYFLDMECIFTHTMQHIFMHHQYINEMNTDTIRIARLDNDELHENLKKKVFRYAERIGEENLVADRKFFYESLVTTASHIRIHRRRHPFDQRPTSAGVLIGKHPSIYTVHCKKKHEILTPRKSEDKTIETASLDSMFQMYCRSCKEGDPLAGLVTKHLFNGPNKSYGPPNEEEIKIESQVPRIFYSKLLAQWVLIVDPPNGANQEEEEEEFDAYPVVTVEDSTFTYCHPSLMMLFVFFRERFRDKYKSVGKHRFDTIDVDILNAIT